MSAISERDPCPGPGRTQSRASGAGGLVRGATRAGASGSRGTPTMPGPSAMEAIFAESSTYTYVGPNPAINAYARSGGRGNSYRRWRGDRGLGAGRSAGRRFQKRQRFPRQADCDASVRQHPGRRCARLARRRRLCGSPRPAAIAQVLPTSNPTSSRSSRPGGSMPFGPWSPGSPASSWKPAARSWCRTKRP